MSPELSKDLSGLVNEYLKFAEGIGLQIDYERSYIDNDSAIIYVSNCSAGVKLGYPIGTCRAMNEMDREIIRLLGGCLKTTHTIAENGKYCKFHINY